jgi:hypothetical protein
MSLLQLLGLGADFMANSDNRSISKEDRERTLAALAEIMGEQRSNYGPYMGWGKEAGGNLNAMLFGSDEKFNDLYGRYKDSMGYQSGFKSGQDAVETSAANRGGLYSGKNGMNLARFGADYNQKFLDSFYDRAFDQEKIGLAATGGMGSALSHYGDQVVGINALDAQNRMNANTNNASAVNNFSDDTMNAMFRLFGTGAI